MSKKGQVLLLGEPVAREPLILALKTLRLPYVDLPGPIRGSWFRDLEPSMVVVGISLNTWEPIESGVVRSSKNALGFKLLVLPKGTRKGVDLEQVQQNYQCDGIATETLLSEHPVEAMKFLSPLHPGMKVPHRTATDAHEALTRAIEEQLANYVPRSSARAHCFLPVTVRMQSRSPEAAFFVNLSRDGARMRMSREFSIDDELQLSFSVLDQNLTTNARIIWVGPGQVPDSYLAGLEFDGLGDAQREVIEAFVRKQLPMLYGEN